MAYGNIFLFPGKKANLKPEYRAGGQVCTEVAFRAGAL